MDDDLYIERSRSTVLPKLELFSHTFNLANAWVGIADNRLAWLSLTTPSRETIQSFWNGDIQVFADHLPPPFDVLPADLEPIINQQVQFPLLLVGTAFQLSVWKALREIPIAQTITYGELARSLGRPNHARAVGNAIAANPIACFVPCHRVLPSNHSVGNYRWGPLLKSRLLEAESLCV